MFNIGEIHFLNPLSGPKVREKRMAEWCNWLAMTMFSVSSVYNKIDLFPDKHFLSYLILAEGPGVAREKKIKNIKVKKIEN